MDVGRVDAGDSPIILDGIRKVLSKAKAPGVLRLVFHDAGTYDMGENSGIIFWHNQEMVLDLLWIQFLKSLITVITHNYYL